MISRCDIHVHSKHSDRPSEWYLDRIGAPESFTEPLEIYRIARATGMDFVTVSDHDSIARALEIAHLPGTFLASEETVTFPEDGCDVHILVLGLSEEQHRELQRLKRNLYEFRSYARQEGIVHLVAHPLFRVNDRLTLAHFEKLLVLFRRFEGVNGTRDLRATELLDAVLGSMTGDIVAELAERHRLTLDFDPLDPADAPRYATTGGSDDHGGLYPATTWTETPSAGSVAEYLDNVRTGRCTPGGEAGSSLKLARSFQTLAHDYYRAKVLGGSRWKNDPLADLLRRIASGELDPENPEGTALGRTVRKWLAFAPPASSLRPDLAGNHEAFALADSATLREAERRTFESACRLGQRAAARALESAVSELERGDLLRALPALSDLAPVVVALSPYFAAFRFQHKDEGLHRETATRFKAAATLLHKSPHLAWATDTLHDVNGVARTITSAARLARRRGLELTVLASECGPLPGDFDCENFAPIWETPVPQYEELSLRVPPVLELIEHCERENYGRILISTPGPVGLSALAAGKLLGLPTAAIYHTDFPRYVAALGGDGRLETLSRSYISWFYRQVDEVFVSSGAYRKELIGMGIAPDRLRDLPRGVDLELFTPAKRQPLFFGRWGLQGAPTVLYAGRLSAEKNLDSLFRAFRALRERGSRANLAIVGDGPARRSLEMRWRAPEIAFTGFLHGEELAAAYASADLFVFPSRTDTFGNAVLESMASGVPAIVAREGGPAEQVRHAVDGLIVDLDVPEALTEAMTALLDDPDLRCRLGEWAREAAAARSWDHLLAAILPDSPASREGRIDPSREIEAEAALAAAI
ncbi:MAG: glycosyltransferase [Thermoanaerobaculia bacterium]